MYTQPTHFSQFPLSSLISLLDYDNDLLTVFSASILNVQSIFLTSARVCASVTYSYVKEIQTQQNTTNFNGLKKQTFYYSWSCGWLSRDQLEQQVCSMWCGLHLPQVAAIWAGESKTVSLTSLTPQLGWLRCWDLFTLVLSIPQGFYIPGAFPAG